MLISDRARAWLQFFRIGGVTSALSGSFWGFLVLNQGQSPWWTLIPILVVSFSIYLFGMGLNDLVDLKKDRELRSGRPLPSGRLELAPAKWACVVILLFGCTTMLVFLEWFQIGCFSLAFLFVAIYNLKSKHSRVAGPLTIALARSLNVLGGMAFFQSELVALPLLHFIHTIGIFVIAEGEDKESAIGWGKMAFLCLVPGLMIWPAPIGALLWFCCILWLTKDFRGSRQERANAARLVGGLVGAFTLMEACYLLGTEAYSPGLIFMGLYLLGKHLQKTFPAG